MQTPRITSVLAFGGQAKSSFHEVDPRLAGKVDAYWTFTVETPPVELRIIPDARIDLIFDLDAREGFVAGPNLKPFDVRHERPTRLLGATLSPEAAASALGIDIRSLVSDWSPLERSLGPIARSWSERIAAGAGEIAQVAALETILLARIGPADRRVARAVAEIRRSSGRVDVAALSRASGASARNLNRLFDRWVGLSPKAFARIARVQEALRRMRETPPPNFKTLAVELGFADQAHMSREVKALTGVQPKEMSETFKQASDIFKP